MNQIDLSRTDLNLLVLFETVLEERHVGRAAERLNLTPSAVSHGLNRLRRLLNDPLFIAPRRGADGRAELLAEPIADAGAAAERHRLSRAVQPQTSTRRFIIRLRRGVGSLPAGAARRSAPDAPGIDVGIRQLLPMQRSRRPNAPGAAFSPISMRARWTSPSCRRRDSGALPPGGAHERLRPHA